MNDVSDGSVLHKCIQGILSSLEMNQLIWVPAQCPPLQEQGADRIEWRELDFSRQLKIEGTAKEQITNINTPKTRN
jgi:hypothetical protein